MWHIGKPLRAWQEVALVRWRSRRRGVVSVVTGGGKTLLALACMAEVRAALPDCRYLIVVPTVALLDQWVSELENGLGVGRDDIAMHGGGFSGPADRRVHVAVINTARSLAPKLLADGDWFYIGDECHRFGAPFNRGALPGPMAATLGLSATPIREYDPWFEEYVAPALGEILIEYGYEAAARDHVLAPFALHNYRVPTTDEEDAEISALRRRIANRLREGATPDDEQLQRLLRARARLVRGISSRIPAAVAILDRHRGRRALVFHESIDAAVEITRQLERKQHRVLSYHSGLGPVTRQRNLFLFSRGVVDVLVTCRALDEGLNVPDVEPWSGGSLDSSTRQRIQRLGRVLRPAPGKASALVCTLYATPEEQDRLTAEAGRLEGVAETKWYRVQLAWLES